MRVISGLHDLTLSGFSTIVLQKGDELEDAENDQAKPGVYKCAEIDFKCLVARGERQIGKEGIIESITQKNDQQPTEIACHVLGHPSSVCRRGAQVGCWADPKVSPGLSQGPVVII